MQLQPRDKLVLRLLVEKVSRVTPDLLAFWFGGRDESTLRKRCTLLRDAGFVEFQTVPLKVLPEISGPLLRWKPGQERPHFGKLSWAARRRWKNIPARRRLTLVATDLSRSFFGHSPRQSPRPESGTHDVAMLMSFLWCLARWPRLIWHAWQGEQLYDLEEEIKYGKVEDARVLDPRSGQIWFLVEGIGQYSPSRIQSFHEEFGEQKQLTYWMF